MAASPRKGRCEPVPRRSAASSWPRHRSCGGWAWVHGTAVNGPLTVWLWNELRDRQLPVVRLDARHANAALKVRPAKTDRNDAAGLAQIVRTGWYMEVRIKTRASYEVRALLSARDVPVSMRVRLEAQVRGPLRTFGVLFGKQVGGFAKRAREIQIGRAHV